VWGATDECLANLAGGADYPFGDAGASAPSPGADTPSSFVMRIRMPRTITCRKFTFSEVEGIC